MARQPRFYYPGAVLHVIQRGNNRERIFVRDEDRQFFLGCLARAVQECGVLVHAYVLMTNHVHLLASPLSKESLPKALQSVGRRYVQYFNHFNQRSGTLWEGRYRSTVVDSESYLLTCMRYIELNPVRAGIVVRPGDYRWTSFHANALGAPDTLIDRHELYDRLGKSDSDRQGAYRELFRSQLPQSDVDAIREATNKNWALGSKGFRRQVEALAGRRPDRMRLGRPSRPLEGQTRLPGGAISRV